MKYLLSQVSWKCVIRYYYAAKLHNFRASIRSFVDSSSSISSNVSINGPASLMNVSINEFSYVTSSKLCCVNVGKYCSIGPGSFIGGLANHPWRFISTSPLFYSRSPEFKLNSEFCDNDVIDNYPDTVDIGNDVWIGANVLILPGVKVGDGVVIGAGAVVTKNIDPFSIVAGVPARVIKKRFGDDVIQKLIDAKWWDWDVEFFKDNPCIFSKYSFDDVLDKYKKWSHVEV